MEKRTTTGVQEKVSTGRLIGVAALVGAAAGFFTWYAFALFSPKKEPAPIAVDTRPLAASCSQGDLATLPEALKAIAPADRLTCDTQGKTKTTGKTSKVTRTLALTPTLTQQSVLEEFRDFLSDLGVSTTTIDAVTESNRVAAAFPWLDAKKGTITELSTKFSEEFAAMTEEKRAQLVSDSDTLNNEFVDFVRTLPLSASTNGNGAVLGATTNARIARDNTNAVNSINVNFPVIGCESCGGSSTSLGCVAGGCGNISVDVNYRFPNYLQVDSIEFSWTIRW